MDPWMNPLFVEAWLAERKRRLERECLAVTARRIQAQRARRPITPVPGYAFLQRMLQAAWVRLRGVPPAPGQS